MSRESSSWIVREKQDDDSKGRVTSGQLGLGLTSGQVELTSGQRDRPSVAAAAVVSRKRRWSAPDCTTTPTHHHDNRVNNSSSKIQQHGGNVASSK